MIKDNDKMFYLPFGGENCNFGLEIFIAKKVEGILRKNKQIVVWLNHKLLIFKNSWKILPLGINISFNPRSNIQISDMNILFFNRLIIFALWYLLGFLFLFFFDMNILLCWDKLNIFFVVVFFHDIFLFSDFIAIFLFLFAIIYFFEPASKKVGLAIKEACVFDAFQETNIAFMLAVLLWIATKASASKFSGTI